jgi:hypothetical protein
MKILVLVEALVLISLLLVHTGPASAAAGASIEVDAILGAGLLADNSLLLIDVVHGDVAVANRTPTTVDQGSYTLVVNKVPTQTACTIDSVTPDCTQANIVCGPAQTAHTVVAADPSISSKGSFDGIEVRSGNITITCIDQQFPAPPAKPAAKPVPTVRH